MAKKSRAAEGGRIPSGAGEVKMPASLLPLASLLSAGDHCAMSIFQKIIDRQIPADIVYEDDKALAFRDINPQAPVHILVIPRRPIPKLADLETGDVELAGHLLLVAREVAAREKLTDFRVVINNGPGSGQTVYHLHVHVLGGRPFGWPPG
jgi:histidine triad (HIT) family protein